MRRKKVTATKSSSRARKVSRRLLVIETLQRLEPLPNGRRKWKFCRLIQHGKRVATPRTARRITSPASVPSGRWRTIWSSIFPRPTRRACAIFRRAIRSRTCWRGAAARPPWGPPAAAVGQSRPRPRRGATRRYRRGRDSVQRRRPGGIAATPRWRARRRQKPQPQRAGRLVGPAAMAPSTACLAAMYRFTKGQIPSSAAAALPAAPTPMRRSAPGASLVQLYSALVFHGTGLVGRIKRELAALLRRDGFGAVCDAVGADQR